ncbi:hypothetical protein [Yoonia sp. 2307UL14-13]|uniref:hypothetical protein n=1 Tax=Yoonia sp. 2307UL14-13 TaxID=3126506 RepID=UPI0040400AA5
MRTVANCVGNICECLDDAIEELLNNETTHRNGAKGLGQLVSEQTAAGAAGLGTREWNVHDRKIRQQKNDLEDHLEEHRLRGCGGPPNGGSPVPADAINGTMAPNPTKADWEVNNPPTTSEGVTGGAAGDVAAAGTGTLVIYGIYRAARMLPSLWPPLWPTIPANAAAPRIKRICYDLSRTCTSRRSVAATGFGCGKNVTTPP